MKIKTLLIDVFISRPIEASRLSSTKNTMNINCIRPNQDPHRCINTRKKRRSDEMQFLYVVDVSRKIGFCRKFMKTLIVLSSNASRSPFSLASPSSSRCKWKASLLCLLSLLLTNERGGNREITKFVKHPSWRKNILMVFWGTQCMKICCSLFVCFWIWRWGEFLSCVSCDFCGFEKMKIFKIAVSFCCVFL